MSQYVESPEAAQVIENRSQLIDYFYQASKPREAWRIGTEYEMVGVSRRSGRAARYFGKRGIERLLYRLADSLGWEPQEEEGHVIALKGERANISLEPGAQVELSGDERRTNLTGAFAVAKPSVLQGKTILLLDDVATTCSTIHECSLAILGAGAAGVYAACLAFGS